MGAFFVFPQKKVPCHAMTLVWQSQNIVDGY
jgi:hypothetical protein